MNVSIIGTGYVGLVTAVCFASQGHKVLAMDNNLDKIKSLKSGEIPIYEPGLKPLFANAIKANLLQFTNSLTDIVDFSEIIFLTLPTPPLEDGSADLTHVLDVAKNIGKLITSYKIIVDKSTVPVGTSGIVHQAIAKNAKVEFEVISNPEFLREGTAIKDFLHPDRIVVGTETERAANVMYELYKPFIVDNPNKFLRMDIASSELTKYAANSFLAVKLSFINEIANLCEVLGADIEAVAKGIGSDSRIGDQFLKAGLGYGGSCFPKDVSALKKIGINKGVDLKIIASCEEVNHLQTKIFFEKISHHFTGNLKGLNLAVWGLTFKADTDDIRESPAIKLIKMLTNAGAEIQISDPQGFKHKALLDELNIQYYANIYESVKNCEALIIATEWQEFLKSDLNQIKENIKNAIIFDGRNIWNKEYVRNKGFKYISIGRS